MIIIVVQTKGFSKGAAVFKSVRIDGALRKDERKGIGDREKDRKVNQFRIITGLRHRGGRWEELKS